MFSLGVRSAISPHLNSRDPLHSLKSNLLWGLPRLRPVLSKRGMEGKVGDNGEKHLWHGQGNAEDIQKPYHA